MKKTVKTYKGKINDTIGIGKLGDPPPPWDIRLLLTVEGIDRRLTIDYGKTDPVIQRLAGAAASVLGTTPEAWASPDVALQGYPVDVTVLTTSTGYYDVRDVQPAPAGRTRNGLFWKRLEELVAPTPTKIEKIEPNAEKPVEDLFAELGRGLTEADW
jgi:hypothetical protein